MTDKQQTILALSFLSQSCTAALAALADPADPADSAQLHLVLADIDALLALVHALSTKLSLALKPAAPSYPASVPLLRDLAQHASALAHATRLLRDNLHGATLARHVRNRTGDIIDALRALAQTLLNNAARGPQLPGSAASADEYLLRAGTLHDLIANAGFPKDNRTAVYLAWKSDRDSLEDNRQEIARMIEEADSDHAHHDTAASESDDGWDELGLGHAAKMDKDELARAQNVHQVLRLTTLLHKRIFLDLLPYPSSAPPTAFDALLTQSNLFLSASDDLVAALYTPQDPSYVRDHILQLADIATCLQTQIPVLLPATDELATRLHALNVEDRSPVATSTSPSKKMADKKWFDMCVDQIVRLCTNIYESSGQTDMPNSAA